MGLSEKEPLEITGASVFTDWSFCRPFEQYLSIEQTPAREKLPLASLLLLSYRTGVGKLFLRRATLKILLLSEGRIYILSA